MCSHLCPLVWCSMRLTATFSAICSKATMATLVVLGLLMIPVECSVAMGPHTIFVAADAVAALQVQDDAPQPHAGQGAHAAPEREKTDSAPSVSTTTSHRDHDSPQTGQAAASNLDVPSHDPGSSPSSDDSRPSPRSMNYPARPAGISADAVVALDIPGGQPDLIGPARDGRIRFAFTIPPDRFLSGPEPPPP